jgi:hypothetical protein
LDDLLAISIDGSAFDRKAWAYRALFQQVTPNELEGLVGQPDLSLSLQAKFEVLHRSPSPDPKLRKGDIVVPAPSLEFEKHFTKRLGFAPPVWWARGFRVPAGPDFGSGFNSNGLTDRSILPKGLWRKNSGETITVEDTSRRLTIQRDESGDALYVLFAGRFAYVESYNSVVAYPSSLTAYEITSGKRLWKREVWGNYRGGVGGYGVHDLTVEIHNGDVVVYGVGPGSYTEAFRQSDGKPILRFSTNYWFQTPEPRR